MPRDLRPPPAMDGEPILAEHVEAILDAAEGLDLAFVPPLYRSGDAVFVDLPDEFWGQLTGAPTSGKHPWKEVIPATGGLWTDGPRSGTAAVDPAYEVNGSTADLTDKRAWFRREPATGEVRFTFAACS